jgi:hypothetical protein
MKYLVIVVFSLLISSCSLFRKSTVKVDEQIEQTSKTKVNEDLLQLRVPKSNIFLSDRVLPPVNGVYIPISRTITDPVTKQTLKIDLTSDGQLNVASITEADTITKRNTQKEEQVDASKNTTSNTTTEVKAKLTIKDILNLGMLFAGGLIPGLSGLGTGGGGLLLIVIILIAIFAFSKKSNKQEPPTPPTQ